MSNIKAQSSNKQQTNIFEISHHPCALPSRRREGVRFSTLKVHMEKVLSLDI
jgi:hypothetical protein